MQAIGFQITSPSNEKGFLQRDVKAIAQALGTAPVFLDATESKLNQIIFIYSTPCIQSMLRGI